MTETPRTARGRATRSRIVAAAAALIRELLLTSYAQITMARRAGEVTTAKTTLVVNCPVV